MTNLIKNSPVTGDNITYAVTDNQNKSLNTHLKNKKQELYVSCLGFNPIELPKKYKAHNITELFSATYGVFSKLSLLLY